MSSSRAVVIRVDRLTKAYTLWSSPAARLRGPLLRRAASLPLLPSAARARLAAKAAGQSSVFLALHDVSFEVARGETVGVVGRNGSGKSTLLQVIAGTLTPSAGEVSTDGRISALLELGSGFNPDFTGRENLYLNAAIAGLDRRDVDRRFDDVAAFASIGPFMDQPLRTYSSGMYVRLAFAAALCADPDILVIDEALAVGDEGFQRKCFERLRRLQREGRTILLVSHSAQAVVELCHRAILLEDGELLLSGPPKPVVAAYHKLLFAPADSVASLRATLPGAPPPGGAERPPAPTSRPAGRFAPDLVPQSTVAYESRGALIEDARITTLDGERVNVLCRREKYLYRYRVRFTSRCFDVQFGMMIKTVSGLDLGGAVSRSVPDGTCAEAGEVAEVGFTFTCLLPSGVYFLNAGARGRTGAEEIYLHRLVDVLMFRVEPDAEALVTGLVDFTIEPRVEWTTAMAQLAPATASRAERPA